MSTQTTPGGPVIGIATFRTLITPESDDHAHTAQHAQVDHSHSGGGGGSLVEADIPENLGLQNLQIGDAGTYDGNLPSGFVAEVATVTEKLNMIDDAYIRVQPTVRLNRPTSVLIGFDPDTMTDTSTGIFVQRDQDVIIMNHEVGIRAPGHPVEAATFQSEWNMHAERDVSAGNLLKAPEVRTSRIQKFADGHSHITVTAPLTLENGGLNVSNRDSATITAKALDMTKGDIICRNIFASGICEGGTLLETIPKVRSHEGRHLHAKSLTLNDDSIYIGLMRRSYDRATHKPVTHILKRQIPAFLVAKGFALGDIPGPFTVDNMTINNWVTLAQDYLKDTSVEIDTVFPAATTADWEDYVDPISVDLDAAEVEIDDHETRITALEAAGVTIVSGLVDNANVDVLVTDKVLLIKHDEKTGITCTMPASGMTQGQIISIKNMQFGDGSNQGNIDMTITVRPAQNQTPAHFIDFGFTSLTLNASSDAPGGALVGVNEACRLMWESNGYTWIALNDAY